ncbi:MAG: hypothetical protein KKA34_03635 [Candidatus Omnitrophica bacterium]|nr:hypothetical protein [Candidatus Omnitrophota bacterium]
MKKFLGLLMLVTLLNFLFTALGHCWEIKDRNEYLIDVRGDDGDIILNRFSLHNKLKPPGLEITAFGEAQWNTLTSEWEKITLGGETGKYIWKWLYIGQSIQFISGEMLDYMVFNTGNNSVDSTTTVAFDLPLRKNLSLCLFEQYATNLEKGRGEYCETGIELSYNFKESYTLGFGWRHTDRIHNLDTDYVSSSFTLSF